MKAKVEKTIHGKVKAVALKKKRVTYGVVEMHDKFEGGERTHELPAEDVKESKATHEGGSGAAGKVIDPADEGESTSESEESFTASSAFEQLLDSMLNDLKKQQEKENKQKEEGSGEKSEEKKEEEKKKEQQERNKKQKDELLTEYLVTQLRLRALAEILGAVKVAEEGKHYYSYVLVEGEMMSVFRTSPAKKGLILDFDTFPFFDSEEKAQAFLELCHPIINRFCRVMSLLNPIAVTTIGDIEVIHS